jgi:hypothetical protein
MAKSKFWGTVCGLASLPVAAAGGLIEGTYNAVTGNGTFNEGMEKRSGAIIDGAVELGEEHGTALTNGAIGTAFTVVNILIKNENDAAHRPPNTNS